MNALHYAIPRSFINAAEAIMHCSLLEKLPHLLRTIHCAVVLQYLRQRPKIDENTLQNVQHNSCILRVYHTVYWLGTQSTKVKFTRTILHCHVSYQLPHNLNSSSHVNVIMIEQDDECAGYQKMLPMQLFQGKFICWANAHIVPFQYLKQNTRHASQNVCLNFLRGHQ